MCSNSRYVWGPIIAVSLGGVVIVLLLFLLLALFLNKQTRGGKRLVVFVVGCGLLASGMSMGGVDFYDGVSKYPKGMFIFGIPLMLLGGRFLCVSVFGSEEKVAGYLSAIASLV